MHTFRVPPDHLKAALLFAGKMDVRFYLNGVLLERTEKHARLVATDGSRLVVINLGAGAPGRPVQYIVPRVACEAAVRAYGKLAALNIDCAPDSCSINGIPFTPIDGKFPEYERVIPAKCSGEVVQFNALFLADMAKARKLLGVGGFENVLVAHNGNGAALVDLSEDAFAVLMSVGGKKKTAPSAPPAWFTGVAA